MEEQKAAMNEQVNEKAMGAGAEGQSAVKNVAGTAERKEDPRGRSLAPELREKYSKSRYVRAINNVGDITYERSFYVDMYGYIHYAGKTYEEAYELLGFKVSELGVNRALSAGKRAVQMAENGTLYKANPGKFNGTIPYSSMNLGEMDLPDQVGQLTARVIYLEAVNATQKKTFSLWESRD